MNDFLDFQKLEENFKKLYNQLEKNNFYQIPGIETEFILLFQLFEGVKEAEDFVEICNDLFAIFLNLYEYFINDPIKFKEELILLENCKNFIEKTCSLVEGIDSSSLNKVKVCSFDF